MAIFMLAYEPVREWEGGWCNVSGDAGGETYAGIARNFFPAWKGWKLVDQAKHDPSFHKGNRAFSKFLDTRPGLRTAVEEWYRNEWWNKLPFDKMDQVLANEIFEEAVNLGWGGMGKSLQKFCNAANYNAKTGKQIFSDIKIDGAVGQKTLSAFNMILKNWKSDAVAHALNAMQGARYIDIAYRIQRDRKFLAGWMTRTYDPQISGGKK